jgi:hypothetical protein
MKKLMILFLVIGFGYSQIILSYIPILLNPYILDVDGEQLQVGPDDIFEIYIDGVLLNQDNFSYDSLVRTNIFSGETPIGWLGVVKFEIQNLEVSDTVDRNITFKFNSGYFVEYQSVSSDYIITGVQSSENIPGGIYNSPINFMYITQQDCIETLLGDTNQDCEINVFDSPR